MSLNLEDKISACYAEETAQYTDFLTLEESSQAIRSICDFGIDYRLWGGYDDAERKMLCITLSSNDIDFPICILKGEWDKFSMITHRDVLGSIMATGIERKCVGDILLDADHRTFYLFVVARLAHYFMQNVDRIGRASITWSVANGVDVLPKTLCETKRVSVSALRIDAVLSALLNMSRQKTQDLIDQKLVFVNHLLVTKHTHLLGESDSVVIRGYGKFVFVKQDGFSKKGKTYILIKQYL